MQLSHCPSLCTCWVLTLQDGTVLGFTSHDQDLQLDDVPCQALPGGASSEIALSETRSGQSTTFRSAITSDAITEAAIEDGRFDNATVTIWQVDWQAPEHRHEIFRGWLGTITRQKSRFEAEVMNGTMNLRVPHGRIFGRLCEAELGDARCAVDLDDPRYQVAATVVQVQSPNTLILELANAVADGWFNAGKLEQTDGTILMINDHQTQGARAVLSLRHPIKSLPQRGEQLRCFAGCNKRFAQCRDKFANALNFRGFPHIPGSRTVARLSAKGARHNGAPLVK